MGQQSRGTLLAGKSSFGPQYYSHRQTFPVISFTKGTNEQRAKLYDKQICKSDVASVVSPGPAEYQLPKLFGTASRQADFTLVPPREPSTARAHTVWSSTRASSYYAKEWNMTSFGRDVGLLRAKPCYTFGTSNRDMNPKMLLSKELAKTDTAKGFLGPGPGGTAPDKYSSFGLQMSSKRRTSHKATFGRATRWEQESKDHVPGPGSYDC